MLPHDLKNYRAETSVPVMVMDAFAFLLAVLLIIGLGLLLT